MPDFWNTGRAMLHIYFLAALKKIYMPFYKSRRSVIAPSSKLHAARELDIW